MYEKGYVQVYTGNGKGKTTASLGLALRAICAGNNVFIAQFMKGCYYSELKISELLPGIVIEQFGDVCFVGSEPSERDIELSKLGVARVKEVIKSGKYDLVIMDEVNVAVRCKLVSIDELKDIIESKPDNVELVFTGRYASDAIIGMADLVTEMREIKHYYTKGVEARIGIEK